MLKTPVLHNRENTLAYMPSLIETSFGVETVAVGSCLIAQVCSSIASQVRIPVQRLVEHVDTQLCAEVPLAGHTLDQIISALQVPFAFRGDWVSLDLRVTRYYTPESVCHAVIDGTPVIIAIDSDAYGVMSDEATVYKDGCVEATIIRASGPSQRFHALLAFGCIVEKDRKYLVLRDSREEYAFKGYLKLNLNLFDAYFQNIGAISIDVLGYPIIEQPEAYED